MKPSQVPDVDKIRGQVHAEVARVQQAMQTALTQDGRLVWDGFELRVDAGRWMVVPKEDLANADARALERCTARRCRSDADKLADAIAEVLGGVDMPRTLWDYAAADFVTYFVVQPMVNPAFAPLLLLALDREVGQQKAMSWVLSDVVGPLAYDMASFPASRDGERDAVRRAQIEFLRDAASCQLEDEEWLAASDAAWAARCEQAVVEAGAGARWWSAIATRIRRVAEAIYPLPRSQPARPLTSQSGSEAVYRLGPFQIIVPTSWPVRIAPFKAGKSAPDPELESELFGRGLYFEPPSIDYWRTQFRTVESLESASDDDVAIHVVRGDLALGNIEWIDQAMLVAMVRSDAGFFEIVFRGPHAIMAGYVPRFRQLVASRTVAVSDRFESRAGGRFGFGPFTFVLPVGWHVHVGAREIALPAPAEARVFVRYLGTGLGDRRGLAIRQSRMLLGDDEVPIRVVIEPIAGRQIAISRVTRQPERMLVAFPSAPDAEYELVLRALANVVDAHEPAFEQLVHSLELVPRA